MDGANLADELTVVVIGLNAAATLERCLASVAAAAAEVGGGARVVYVDGGSRDGSVAIARRLGADVITLTTDRPTAAKGRNAGWRVATTPLVHFVDSDTVIERDWLARATTAIRGDNRIACVFGQLREANPTGSVYNEVCGCDWYVTPGDARYCGGNALFRLEALRDVDGSDDSLVAGEEVDLCWRLRRRSWRVVCLESLMGYHDLGMTGLRSYWRRAVRSGHAYAELGLRYARTSDPLWLRELVRNLAIPPAVVVLVVALLSLLGAPGIAVAAAVLSVRPVLKFVSLRERIPEARLRALYVAHLAAVRLPLFVGSAHYLLGRVTSRGTRG